MSALEKKVLICGNCKSDINKGDKYCRICGTSITQAKYVPNENIMQCIYGPLPVKRKHVCQKCSYEWTTFAMVDDEKYCPECGGLAPCQKEDDSYKAPPLPDFLRRK